MIKGITEKEYPIIKNILSQYPYKFYAYGSRVKGNFSPLSDLDILVVSDNYDEIISNLKDTFDRSRLPYIVNFTNFNTMDKDFYEIIKNDLVEI